MRFLFCSLLALLTVGVVAACERKNEDQYPGQYPQQQQYPGQYPQQQYPGQYPQQQYPQGGQQQSQQQFPQQQPQQFPQQQPTQTAPPAATLPYPFPSGIAIPSVLPMPSQIFPQPAPSR